MDHSGDPIRCQTETLARWPDQSIRWCRVEFFGDQTQAFSIELDPLADVDADLARSLESRSLQLASAIEDNPSLPDWLRLGQSGTHVSNDRFDTLTPLQPVEFSVRLRHGGVDYSGVFGDLKILASGPVRWSCQWQVTFETDGDQTSGLAGDLIVNSFPDHSLVTAEFCIRNPDAMDHPGGNWDLGADGSVIIDDLSIEFELPGLDHSSLPISPNGNGEHALALELTAVDGFDDANKVLQGADQITLYQASSGGGNWQSQNHLDRTGNVSLPFRGYQAIVDGKVHKGLRADPVLRCRLGQIDYSIGCRDFWQNFPAVLSVGNRCSDGLPENDDGKQREPTLTMRIGLFPREATMGHELQGGEQKTFQFAVERKSLEADSKIRSYLNPARIRLSPEVYANAGAWSYLTSRSELSDPRYEALVDQAVIGDDTFATKAEKIDQFGWRNYGDLYGDHEAVDHVDDEPMVSHYNNQYDCTLGFAVQYLRSGDSRWFDLMIRMADHAWDIDTYHTDKDKLLYNGGLFWHTYHYAPAHTATHRSYPRRLHVAQSFAGGQDLADLGDTGVELTKNYAIGGGPAAAHNYSTGWMLAYWLTGAERYRTAAINAADYVLRIDDGRKTPFRYLCRGDTGYSTCSSDGYYGPGRAAANSTHALLSGHELTGDETYLQRAAVLMRRTVHPADDLASLDLLNAELRWFYTMYLQALGRFVDYKDSLGQRDEDFDYGVAVLLHYATWMAEHERPTLSKPDELQYPNETWAAQDMRKWHVLQHAALYQTDTEKRSKLVEKAEFFFNDVCESLSQLPTRTLCRPVVLMLNFGWQRDWFRAHGDECRIARISDSGGEKDFGKPSVFVPQRAIALRRFKRLVKWGGIAVIGISMQLVVSLLLQYRP